MTCSLRGSSAYVGSPSAVSTGSPSAAGIGSRSAAGMAPPSPASMGPTLAARMGPPPAAGMGSRSEARMGPLSAPSRRASFSSCHQSGADGEVILRTYSEARTGLHIFAVAELRLVPPGRVSLHPLAPTAHFPAPAGPRPARAFPCSSPPQRPPDRLYPGEVGGIAPSQRLFPRGAQAGRASRSTRSQAGRASRSTRSQAGRATHGPTSCSVHGPTSLSARSQASLSAHGPAGQTLGAQPSQPCRAQPGAQVSSCHGVAGLPRRAPAAHPRWSPMPCTCRSPTGRARARRGPSPRRGSARRRRGCSRA